MSSARRAHFNFQGLLRLLDGQRYAILEVVDEPFLVALLVLLKAGAVNVRDSVRYRELDSIAHVQFA